MSFIVGPIVKGGKQYNSMKMGYSRGLPIYDAPKLLTEKKQEEYFVASLYAQLLIYNGYTVLGVEVCNDDSDGKADVKIKTTKEVTGVQITRFTLTNLLHRQSASKKRAFRIVNEVLKQVTVSQPINVVIHSTYKVDPPKYKEKMDTAIANEIVKGLNANKNLEQGVPKPHMHSNQSISKIASYFTYERIPDEMYSNFYGQSNLYINFDFDNVGFDDSDVIREARNIFKKKERGNADLLLIWAEYSEILYKHSEVAELLKTEFKDSKFDQVIFFSFYNTMHLHMENPIRQTLIK